MNRQDFWERALEWVSRGNIDGYMSQHRYDDNLVEVKMYFTSVMDWVSGVFVDVKKEMRGLEWGRLYETYHTIAYDPSDVAAHVQRLYADPYVKNYKGIFEYILGGLTDTKLLHVRVFDEATKKAIYAIQTEEAVRNNVSNCPLCAIGHDANKATLWKIADMDADHVTAWSRGGATDEANCQMLCKTHNRAKGNR